MELILDNWEGSLNIDEPTLLEAGIRADIIRLNDMNGGHHIDEYFAVQWIQAERFLRAPYFVYNPWVSGAENYEWCIDHLPIKGVTRLMIDIEVRKTGYSPETYADEVATFFDLIWDCFPLAFPYTGGGYIGLLAHWIGGDYAWARYPYTFYPPTREEWTWEKLIQKLGVYGYAPDPYKKCPGIPKIWQFTGDRLIMPGCANRPIDINAWNGTLAELETWWGAKMPEPPISKLDILWREAERNGWDLTP